MTMHEILQAKLQTAKTEVAAIEADIVALTQAGWLATEEAQIKAWIQSAARHLGL